MDTLYILVDPIGRFDSGISTYTSNAAEILRARKNDVMVLSKIKCEDLNTFRQRLALEITLLKKQGRRIIVEAPETGAVTANIPNNNAYLHIRLHCSKNLGALVQGEFFCQKVFELEKKELIRAQHISAPSMSAILASRQLFGMTFLASCYPNPALPFNFKYSRNFKNNLNNVLFVGRWHALKGVHWLVEFAKKIPRAQFTVVTILDNTIPKKLPKNISLLDGAHWDKAAIYAKANVVIIPSIYETASMVGIEALQAGVPIIAWAHLGICEYAPSPKVQAIDPWDVDAYAAAISHALSHPYNLPEGIGILKILNDCYLSGHEAALSGKFSNHMPESLKNIAFNTIHSFIKQKKRAQMELPNTQPRWKRKLKKMLRDPVLFFKDSKVGKLVTGSSTKQVSINTTSTQLGSSTVELEHPVTAKKEMLFSNIGKFGVIKFQKPPEAPVGLITAFFYSEEREFEATLIKNGLNNFTDFRYVRPPFLQTGIFSVNHSEHVSDLLDRIYKKEKETISLIDHIIFLDAPPNLVKALRCSGTRQRAIVILTDINSISPDPWHTDVLIIVDEAKRKSIENNFRRIITVNNFSDLPNAIRRAIMEGSPKSPDALLPIIGFDYLCRDELLSIDVRYHQALIRVKNSFSPKFNNMFELYDQLGDATTELAVSESIYLRYRSLLDRIRDPGVMSLFLSFSIFDGVIFDVRS
ncbi:MAG: glycosyltransferase family 4 protein [Deltaproteobacteria bacterium]|nr:glycosyltransferase family 4 protein [Deltaproteobacteria bacterium]